MCLSDVMQIHNNTNNNAYRWGFQHCSVCSVATGLAQNWLEHWYPCIKIDIQRTFRWKMSLYIHCHRDRIVKTTNHMNILIVSVQMSPQVSIQQFARWHSNTLFSIQMTINPLQRINNDDFNSSQYSKRLSSHSLHPHSDIVNEQLVSNDNVKYGIFDGDGVHIILNNATRRQWQHIIYFAYVYVSRLILYIKILLWHSEVVISYG